jgi:hypothetical protein
MLYSYEYDFFKVIEENKEISFDKFMEDILRRENSEASEPELLSEETIQENEELVKKAEEAEELRQLRSQRYTDSVYSKIVWK